MGRENFKDIIEMKDFMKNNPLSIFLNSLLSILSYLIKKQKGTFLVGARFGKFFSENSKYLYLYANKIKNNDNFVWFTRNKSLFKRLKKEGLPVVYAFSFRGFYKILTSEKLIISSSPKEVSYFRYLFGNFKIIQLCHGNGIKNVDYLSPKSKSLIDYIRKYFIKKQYSKYDFLLHTSRKTKSIISKSFSNGKVILLGYPRNDFKKNTFYTYEDLEFIPSNKKIFLYAPTYRDVNTGKKPFQKKFLYKLNELLKKKGYYLIMKNHFHDEVKGIGVSNLTKFENILDISEKNLDIQELLQKVDILITDYSSSCFDFSLLKKPIIFYPYDYEQYVLNCKKIIINYFNDLPGPFAKTEEELFDLISDLSWSKRKSYLKKYEKFVADFNDFKDSKSCERVYEKLV